MPHLKCTSLASGAMLLFLSTLRGADTQSFTLTELKDLVPHDVKVDLVEYKGRQAFRVMKPSQGEGFAFLKGSDFQDGTIEADLAVKITTPPGVRMPGFLGVGFRTRLDGAHYDMFYIRPGNSQAEDQAMRNHSVQYCAAPGYDWYRLRREWPWVYEAHADLQLDGWTNIKIEVLGRTAKLFVNGSEKPSLVVDGLKGGDLRGAVALWGFQGEESYFSNVRVTSAAAKAVQNGADAAGAWELKFSSDAGVYDGSMKLSREGNKISGMWTGAFGSNLPVAGTWRDGYVELSFNATWPSDVAFSKSREVTAMMAGWIDGDSAKGRMKVEGRADGQWLATRKR